MLVQIPDHVCLPYQAMADKSGRTLNGVITAQLERFQALHPGKRAIVVDVEKVEKLLGGLPIVGGEDLLHRITQLAALSFGHIKLDLNPAQLAELEHRANRQGKPVDQLVKEMAEVILRDLFWANGGGPAKDPSASQERHPSVAASTAGV